jgi:hypothetical protein
MEKDLIVAIFAPTGTKGATTGVFGTGYPVTENLILTSRHVVEPENRNSQAQITVKWFYDRPANSKPPSWTPADLVWTGKGDLDAALLRCRRPEYLRKFALGRLVGRRPREGELWQSAGFALASKCAKVRKPGRFGGTLRSMAEGDPFFELLENAQPARARQPIAESQWGGVSGMPVFVGSEILGVVRHVPPNYGNKKLEAVPVWRLLEDDSFKKALGLDEEGERLKRACQLLCRLLERSDEVTRDLARVLSPKSPCDEILDCRAQVVELLLTQTPPLERLFELALLVQAKRRGLKDRVGARVAVDLMLTILPAIHDAAVVTEVRQCRGDVSICPLALPTKLRTLAEIIMAGADRRAASLRPPATKLADPEGVASLPEPPESGRDPDSKQFSRDWRIHLLETFDADLDRFKDAFQDYLKERFIPSHLRSPSADISEKELLDTVAEQLRLEAEAEGGLTYYFIARMPKNSEAREKREVVLAELKQTFPHIAFLRLAGAEPLNVEWNRYSKLRDLLYDPETEM